MEGGQALITEEGGKCIILSEYRNNSYYTVDLDEGLGGGHMAAGEVAIGVEGKGEVEVKGDKGILVIIY